MVSVSSPRRPQAGAKAKPASQPAAKAQAKGSAKAPAQASAKARRFSRVAAWDSPVMSYYLLLGSAAILLALGLAMVLSSSMIFSLRDTAGESALTNFSSQAIYALIALPVAFILSRLRLNWLENLAWPAMFLGLGLQALLFVPGMQRSQGGNAAWVYLGGGVSIQPSEFAKLSLAIWLGAVLAKKGHLLAQWRHIIMPAGLGIVACLGLVMVGHDLGTGLIFAMLAAGALFIAGVPLSKLMGLAIAAAGIAAFYVSISESRRMRVSMFFSGAEAVDPQGAGLQPARALEALGTGGISGVGLGASRNKWLYLPESHNDYIFAIIGEELGLLGALLVIGLFVVLAIAITRIVRRHESRFAKISAAGIGTWIVGQALVNICVVVGLMPVIGVPLPLVSAGGSSLVATMMAIGVLLALARSEPGAPEYFQSRSGVVRRSVAAMWRGDK